METFAVLPQEKTDNKHQDLPTVVSESLYWVVYAGLSNTLTQTLFEFL